MWHILTQYQKHSKMKKTILIFTISLFSCNNHSKETPVKNENVVLDSTTRDTATSTEKIEKVVISDTIKRFIVDDFPVTDKMLRGKTEISIKSGLCFSWGQAWFSNDTLNQILVFELYTDGHRMVIYHCYNNAIPNDLIRQIDLNSAGGDLASEKQKQKDFKGFIKQSIKINSSYFVTDKGFKLGIAKQKAIDQYGNPDTSTIDNGIEKLEWDFVGDQI